MSRITRKNILTALNILNGQMIRHGSKSRYELEIWTPGDRYGSRYKLTDAGHSEVSHSLRAGEMYEVLYTLINVIERLPK